ncbi:SRPBCC family protein [Enterococcus sp. BWR-S5]|uniref:SRPBCC family protein n=1 Tax=Enterococcus sp. BWR-S5 TaxID=2787714 RepID=UPI001922E73A|nr:SRPBCC family protein [Enterococcus sp. BWR-S5]MBL1225060.1 SRPBCC family protein [Enterococcus sp. BWR-S5]
MTTVNSKAMFDCDCQTIWQIVTSLTDYSWRSDISRIDIVSETEFIEHTPDGYATTFRVTASEEPKYWAFDLENDTIKGHWTGSFTAKNGRTEIDFTEIITAKKLVMKPFVKGYLKKQQAQYIADLQQAIAKK